MSIAKGILEKCLASKDITLNVNEVLFLTKQMNSDQDRITAVADVIKSKKSSATSKKSISAEGRMQMSFSRRFKGRIVPKKEVEFVAKKFGFDLQEALNITENYARQEHQTRIEYVSPDSICFGNWE